MLDLKIIVVVTTIFAIVTQIDAQEADCDVAVDNIQKKDIFPDDKRMLKRMACVASNYGLAAGYNRAKGGPWQDSEFALTDSKKTEVHPKLQDKIDKIKNNLNIDWKNVDYGQLEETLKSALCMRLCIDNVGKNLPHSIDGKGQAKYWKKHFPSSKTEKDFIDCAKRDLEKQELDIAFVLDNSGSIKDEEFQKAKNFVIEFTNCFKIGLDKTRVGVIEYSKDDHQEVVFYMNEKTNNNDVRAAIEAIQYVGGDATKTGKAITEMRTKLFDENNGARAHTDTTRIGIVITDGVSHDNIKEAADAARQDHIEMFAIAVRDLEKVNADGLKEIADEDVNVSTVSEFGEDCKLVE